MVNKIPVPSDDLSRDVETNRLTPERGLFAGVLWRAVVDLDPETYESRQYLKSAVRWFRSTDKSRKIITYSWCIEVLDLSSDQLMYIEKMVSKAETFLHINKNIEDIPANSETYRKRRRRGRFGNI